MLHHIMYSISPADVDKGELDVHRPRGGPGSPPVSAASAQETPGRGDNRSQFRRAAAVAVYLLSISHHPYLFHLCAILFVFSVTVLIASPSTATEFALHCLGKYIVVCEFKNRVGEIDNILP